MINLTFHYKINKHKSKLSDTLISESLVFLNIRRFCSDVLYLVVTRISKCLYYKGTHFKKLLKLVLNVKASQYKLRLSNYLQHKL